MNNPTNSPRDPQRAELARAAELLRGASQLWSRAANTTDPREVDALLGEGATMIDHARALAFGPV